MGGVNIYIHIKQLSAEHLTRCTFCDGYWICFSLRNGHFAESG